MSIVIIGSGQAGYAVARELRRLDAGVPLVLLTRDGGESYPKPMLSVALAQGKTPASLVLASAGHMAAALDMQVVTGVEVTAIDRQARCVRTRQGDWPYRALVLATGAEPVAPALSGDGAGEVLAVNDLDSYARFRAQLPAGAKVILLGAGLIGCEFACDLLASGHAVTLLDRAAWPAAGLLPQAAGMALLQALQQAGAGWHGNVNVLAVEHSGGGLAVVLDDGRWLAGDLVLSAIGLRPQTALAAGAGLPCDHGILTDADGVTADPCIAALGDCAQPPSGWQPYIAPVAPLARRIAARLSGQIPVVAPALPVPVAFKTPLHPVVVQPPLRPGNWSVLDGTAGVEMACTDAAGEVCGFALTGAHAGKRGVWQGRLRA